MEHDVIPTLDQIKALHKMPRSDDPNYPKNKSLLIWYMDHFMSALAGIDRWGEDKRYHKMPVDLLEVAGKERVLVTAQTEAFGWMLLENCHDKWTAIWKEKKAVQLRGGKFTVPTYNKHDPRR